MADVGVVLDAAGIASLVGGKKGANGAAGQGAQAGFVVALLAQMGKADKAKTTGLPEGVLPPASQTEAQADSADPLALLAKDGKAARGSESLEEIGGHEPGPARLAADSTVLPPATAPAVAAGAGGAVMPTEEATDAPSSAPLRRDQGGTVRPPAMATRQGDSPAIVADKDGKNATGLPAALQDAPPPMEATATGSGSVGETLTAAASPLPAKTEASADSMPPRGFDQVLRQVETRLNVSVEAPVRGAAFAQELGDKVVWLASRNNQVAELSLNPPQLGSVEVRLTLSGGEAGAQFFAASPVAREAIESALPRLRELMAQAGINLGEAQVRDQALSQGRNGDQSGAGGNGSLGEEALPVAQIPATARVAGLGLVDLYA